MKANLNLKYSILFTGEITQQFEDEISKIPRNFKRFLEDSNKFYREVV